MPAASLQQASKRRPAGRVQVIDLNGFRPHPQQRKAHEARQRYKLFGGAIGGAKTTWLVTEALHHCFKYAGARFFLCRHESATFKKTTLLEFLKWKPECVLHHMAEQWFEFPNKSRCDYGGLRPNRGENPLDRIKSMNLTGFGIEEASETQQLFFDFLCTRLRGDAVDAAGRPVVYHGLCTSNPEPGWVRALWIERSHPDFVFIPSKVSDNPSLPPDYADRLRASLPPEMVEQYLEGNWDVQTSRFCVYPFGWLKAAQQRTLERAPQCEMGLDVGAGGDHSVLAARWGGHVEILHKSVFKDTMELVGHVRPVLDQVPHRVCRVDVVGVGKGVYDRLAELGYRVVPFVGGEASSDPDRYANLRAESHWAIRERLERGEMDLPADPDLVARAAAVRYRINSDKKVRIESKDDMRARGAGSPDEMDAVMMAFCGASYGEAEYRSGGRAAFARRGTW